MKSRCNLRIGLMLFTPLILSSCGVMFHGSKQKIKFNCKQDAEVKVNMTVLGRTNQLLVIKRNDLDGLIRISAPGCETKELMLPIKNTVGGWLDVPWAFLPYGSLFIQVDMMYGGHLATESEMNIELNCK